MSFFVFCVCLFFCRLCLCVGCFVCVFFVCVADLLVFSHVYLFACLLVCCMCLQLQPGGVRVGVDVGGDALKLLGVGSFALLLVLVALHLVEVLVVLHWC